MFIRFFIILSLFSSTFILADEGAFEPRKAIALEGIQKRMANLEEHKTCVQAAQNSDQLKECHKKSFGSMKMVGEEMRKERSEKRAELKNLKKDKKESEK